MAPASRVLLFKAPKDNEARVDPFEQALADEGLSTLSIAVLAFEFINLESLAESLHDVSQYAGVIFTSQRAVEAVEKASKMMDDWVEVLSIWKSLPAFVVGTSTAAMASAIGFATTGQDSGSAEALASVITQGVPLHQITVYNTCCNSELERTVKNCLQRDGIPEYIAYFSPSGVKFTYEILKDIGAYEKTKIIAIGPSTAKELQKYKVSVFGTAHKPTPESLINVIQQKHDSSGR